MGLRKWGGDIMFKLFKNGIMILLLLLLLSPSYEVKAAEDALDDFNQDTVSEESLLAAGKYSQNPADSNEWRVVAFNGGGFGFKVRMECNTGRNFDLYLIYCDSQGNEISGARKSFNTLRNGYETFFVPSNVWAIKAKLISYDIRETFRGPATGTVVTYYNVQ